MPASSIDPASIEPWLEKYLGFIETMDWDDTDSAFDELRFVRALLDATNPRYQEIVRAFDLCCRKLGDRRYEILRIRDAVARRLTE